MSFEDLQKKWGEQFSEQSGPSSQLPEAKLWEEIRRSSRRFYWQVGIQAVRDVIYLELLVIISVRLSHPSSLSQGVSPQLVVILKTSLFAFIALTVILAVLRGQRLAPVRGSGVVGRVRRESRRTDATILWWDIERATACLFLIFSAASQALYVHTYRAVSWAAAALYAFSLLLFFLRRYREHSQKPPADDSVQGMLTLAIYRIRNHIRALEATWWFLIPLISGSILFVPVRRLLVTGGSPKGALSSVAYLLVVGYAGWKTNQWIARRKWRPLLEELEKLKAEFAGDSLG